jgi:hypothetical protein
MIYDIMIGMMLAIIFQNLCLLYKMRKLHNYEYQRTLRSQTLMMSGLLISCLCAVFIVWPRQKRPQTSSLVDHLRVSFWYLDWTLIASQILMGILKFHFLVYIIVIVHVKSPIDIL